MNCPFPAFWTEQLDGSGIVEEIKGQHAILLGCIEQLTVMESSRANLVSHLREALREQVGWPIACMY